MMQKISTSTYNKQNIDGFSWMRIIACLAIILLHSLFASTVYFKESMSKGDILFESLTEHMLMWAVPLFLMITGALLLDENREIKYGKLFKVYIKRIVLALIFFTLLFQIIDYYMQEESNILEGFLKDLFLGTSWAHMWYLYLMIGIYLMIPIYKIILEKSSKKQVEYIIIILLIFTSILPMLESFGYNIAFGIPTKTVYPIYLFIGYYLYKYPISKWMAWFLLMVSSFMIIVATIYQGNCSKSFYEFLGTFSRYNSIFVVIQSSAIFSIMKNIKVSVDKFILEVDKSTFGIYLIHMIGIKIIMKWLNINPYEYGVGFFVILTILLFIVSFIVSFLMRKVLNIKLLKGRVVKNEK